MTLHVLVSGYLRILSHVQLSIFIFYFCCFCFTFSFSFFFCGCYKEALCPHVRQTNGEPVPMVISYMLRLITFLFTFFFSLGASHESVHSCISCEKGRVVSSANTEHVSWGTACDVSWVRCGRYLGQQRRVIEQQQQEELVLVQLLQWALFQQPGVMIRPQVVGRSTWFPVRRYIYHQLLSPRCQYQSINQSIH